MRTTGSLALIAVLSACSLPAQTQTSVSPGIVPVIAASGEGIRDVVPDKATIILGVQTRAKSPAAAAAANADRMTAIRAALTRMGIAERDIITARYSVHFEQGRTEADTQYVANNSVTVVTRQLDQVGRIIDNGLGAGANNINSLNYDLIDRKPAQAQALSEAVADARRQAQIMAEAAGGRLGDLIELSTSQVEFRSYYAGDMAMSRMAAAPTPVSAGDVTVTARVNARWKFIQGR